MNKPYSKIRMFVVRRGHVQCPPHSCYRRIDLAISAVIARHVLSYKCLKKIAAAWKFGYISVSGGGLVWGNDDLVWVSVG